MSSYKMIVALVVETGTVRQVPRISIMIAILVGNPDRQLVTAQRHIGYPHEFLGVIIAHRCPTEKTEIPRGRSEEHTSELQSLMRISYAVFCLKTNTAIQIALTY